MIINYKQGYPERCHNHCFKLTVFISIWYRVALMCRKIKSNPVGGGGVVVVVWWWWCGAGVVLVL
jgi:hypothetical protein